MQSQVKVAKRKHELVLSALFDLATQKWKSLKSYLTAGTHQSRARKQGAFLGPNKAKPAPAHKAHLSKVAIVGLSSHGALTSDLSDLRLSEPGFQPLTTWRELSVGKALTKQVSGLLPLARIGGGLEN